MARPVNRMSIATPTSVQTWESLASARTLPTDDTVARTFPWTHWGSAPDAIRQRCLATLRVATSSTGDVFDEVSSINIAGDRVFRGCGAIVLIRRLVVLGRVVHLADHSFVWRGRAMMAHLVGFVANAPALGRSLEAEIERRAAKELLAAGAHP